MKETPQTKLKNVVIARNAYEWQYGGAEQFAYNLARTLQAENINAVVVTRVPELLEHCHKGSIRTFRNLWLKNETRRRWIVIYALLFPVLIAQYAWILLRYRADIAVFSSRDDQVFGTIAAKLVGVPVIWFDHADMKHIVAHRSRFVGRAYYWAMSHADRVIMTSNAEHEKISVNLPASRQSNFVLINNGALVSTGKALERRPGIKVVAYAGRLDREKGLLDLADAAAEVIKRVPEVEFWLAGKGPDEEAFLARLKEHGVSDHFKLLGHMSNVWDLLLSADIFVYPTHHDAAPLAPVEAMLAGVPVVATRIGGIPEVVTPKAGVLVEAHNPAALARALADLLTDPKRLALLREGTKVATAKLSFDSVLRDSYIPLFKKVIESHR